jgi:predicted transcriptional regulator
MKEKLTDAEQDVMKVLWQRKKAFMKDILEDFPEPKPATSTVATLLKRMTTKNLVGYKVYGNSREYFPKVLKEEYFGVELTSMMNRFFDNSIAQFASFFTENAKLSKKELNELSDLINQQIQKKNG